MSASSSELGWFGRSYFGRHWCGDYGLGFSFWVNYVVVTSVLSAVLNGLVQTATELGLQPSAYRAGADWQLMQNLVIAVFWTMVVSLVALCWSLKGAWASASNHTARGGKPGWALAAKGAILLWGGSRALSLAYLVPLFLHISVAPSN